MEEWRDIKGYEGLYQVSDQGRVKSLNYKLTEKEKILKPIKNIRGYWKVNLSKNGKQKTYFIHRIVAQVFIPNPKNMPEINHKNEDKSNNTASNLEWCDRKYNINYGTHNQRAAEARYKKVLQFTKTGIFIKEYPSIKVAERQTGVNDGSISACCLGKYKSAGGFVWKYT